MTAGTSVLEANGVKASFSGVLAVDGVDFEVAGGSVLGLVGPNGSGKTTLLNCVSGFVPLGAGRVFLEGEEITARQAWQRARMGIGRSLQNPRSGRSLRVCDLLAVGQQRDDPVSLWRSALRPWWRLKADARMRDAHLEVLDEFGLPPDILEERLNVLPHGTLKLIDLGRAVLAGDRALLIDEPTSGLGDHEARGVAKAIKSARARGVAVVVVEHNVQFLLDLADSVLVLDQGRRLAYGDPHEVLRRPEVAEAYLGPHATLQDNDNDE